MCSSQSERFDFSRLRLIDERRTETFNTSQSLLRQLNSNAVIMAVPLVLYIPSQMVLWLPWLWSVTVR